MSPLTRRRLLTGASVAAACCATGCATYGTPREPAPTAPTGPAAPTEPTGPGPSAPGTAPAGIAAAADIPVGGGRVFPGEGVVVTQPQAGSYAAFDATCPHAGCLVDQVTGSGISCPCHGSVFTVADGAPVEGPATEPLGRRDVRIEGDRVVLA